VLPIHKLFVNTNRREKTVYQVAQQDGQVARSPGPRKEWRNIQLNKSEGRKEDFKQTAAEKIRPFCFYR
jgi:hypothetical protein